MGLGHFGGGQSAARWLAGQGARVTVTDLADEEALAPALTALADVPLAGVHLGGHREDDFRHVDLVVVNPAVRPGNPLVAIARDAGARLSTEIELFLRACPAPVIGVTGSNGKSTTAAMTAAILRAEGRTTWLGGNIGGSLLDRLDQIEPVHAVVLELSSFQLWYLGGASEGTQRVPGPIFADHARRMVPGKSGQSPAPMPHVAVVTGFSPNHLDWHPSLSHYAAAKQRILTGQNADDLAVLNTFDPEVASWHRFVRGRQIPLEEVGTGSCCSGSEDGSLSPPLTIPGRHNRINAACAAAAARAAGCHEQAIREGLASFPGLPQRLERFAVIQGRRFYNDSAATTPESTVAALESLDEPIWLLAGGRDKGFDFTGLAAAIAERARGAAFFGSVAATLQSRVAALDARLPSAAAETLEQSLRWCWDRSRPGDAIVLSPACSSHDQFCNFRQRGERFVALVAELAASYSSRSA